MKLLRLTLVGLALLVVAGLPMAGPASGSKDNQELPTV